MYIIVQQKQQTTLYHALKLKGCCYTDTSSQCHCSRSLSQSSSLSLRFPSPIPVLSTSASSIRDPHRTPRHGGAVTSSNPFVFFNPITSTAPVSSLLPTPPSPAGSLSRITPANTTFVPPATSIPLPFPSPATTSPTNPNSNTIFLSQLFNPYGILVTNLSTVPHLVLSAPTLCPTWIPSSRTIPLIARLLLLSMLLPSPTCNTPELLSVCSTLVFLLVSVVEPFLLRFFVRWPSSCWSLVLSGLTLD